ncbi:MAG: hypothetical protein JWO80_3848 [Bryobacterales bacterium]|nr:hypothetical protein [Bryobacterales bacterium]
MQTPTVSSASRRAFFIFTFAAARGICAGPWTPFVGTWMGEHASKPFVRVIVSPAMPPEILVVTADVRANGTGEITEVNGDLRHKEVVFRRELENGVLLIKVRQDDGDVVDYEMRVAGEGTTSLQLLQPSGMKPFQLKRIPK